MDDGFTDGPLSKADKALRTIEVTAEALAETDNNLVKFQQSKNNTADKFGGELCATYMHSARQLSDILTRHGFFIGNKEDKRRLDLFSRLLAGLDMLLSVSEHGDFRNGNTDSGGTIDEGEAMASAMIAEARKLLTEAMNEKRQKEKASDGN
jgi:hypothetical protein